MVSLVFGIGVGAAVALLGALAVSLVMPKHRIWPTPGDGSWQGYVWWPLFRGLNALTVASAGLTLWERTPVLGLSTPLRLLALAALAGSVALFMYAFRVLGRDNSYCATDGLVTGGIYRWTRNPQNAMLIVVYGCLAVAADSWPVYVLCAGMMAVYALMVLCEEPWLAAHYGEAYRRYCRRVPRFFHWRRAWVLARATGAGRGRKRVTRA
jgi:protein-S-isoprenylcysteine O-methyltransferase Ste14